MRGRVFAGVTKRGGAERNKEAKVKAMEAREIFVSVYDWLLHSGFRILIIALLLSSSALASEPPHISIGAKITDDGEIEGTVRITVVNDTDEPLDSIPLWLYPNRFSEPAPGLTDRTVNWLYPSESQPVFGRSGNLSGRVVKASFGKPLTPDWGEWWR